jgi:hypothetical protein
MASPIQFYRNFQALMRDHGLRHVLTSGMACVEYGIQQNTKDTDWIIHPDDLEKLLAMLCHCERGLTGTNWRISYRSLFGAPFLKEYHQGGWTTHIAIHDEATSPEHHLDFFGKPPRVALEDVFATAKGHLASRDTIAQMKKTDRDKDWPMVEAISLQMENDWNVMLHLRTPENLIATWQQCPGKTKLNLALRRPLLSILESGAVSLPKALAIERLIWEQVNKQRYRRYQTEWKEFLRRWKTDPYHEWPVECPFAQQHEMLVHAVQTHHLPADPLGDTLAKEKLIEQAILAVLEVFDGNEPLVHHLTPPLSELLP